MAKFYYSEKITGRKKTEVQSEEIWRVSSYSLSFIAANNAATHVQCLCLGNSIRDSAPKVFTRGWSHRNCLPSNYKKSRFPEGKHVFDISHIFCIKSLGTVTHPYQLGNGGNDSSGKFPDDSQGPILQASPSEDSSFRLALLTLSWSDL